jgi:hypothetical protein
MELVPWQWLPLYQQPSSCPVWYDATLSVLQSPPSIIEHHLCLADSSTIGLISGRMPDRGQQRISLLLL